MKIDKEIFRDLYENRPPERCIMRRRKPFLEGLADMYTYMDCDFETCIEVGIFIYESTEFAARVFSSVYAIDNQTLLKKCLYAPDHTFKAGSNHFLTIKKENYEAMLNFLNANPHVFSIISDSKTASQVFKDKSITFCYLDSGHSYPEITRDREVWLPKVKPGGYIGGHDYSEETFPDVVKSVNERFGKPDEVFSDTSWIVKVR